ncbi:MAG: alpha/beta hydrolase [Pseudomonadota bacterium]
MDAKVDYEPRARRVELPSRGGEMAVLDFGPPERPVDLVFSHANGFNARTYRTILSPLAQAFRILAVDLRGHGASTLPADPARHPGWHGFRDDLLALLASEATGPVVLAGHSMGGTTSLLAAAAEPERVKALVLFDPVIFDGAQVIDRAGDNGLAAGAERRRAVFPDKTAVVTGYTGKGAFRTWRPEQLADYVEAGFKPTEAGEVTLACAPAWEAANFRTHGYDPFGALAALARPTRILRAEHGSTCRIEDHLAVLDGNPNIRHEVVPGTSHFLPMERPDLVREVLGGFLA